MVLSAQHISSFSISTFSHEHHSNLLVTIEGLALLQFAPLHHSVEVLEDEEFELRTLRTFEDGNVPPSTLQDFNSKYSYECRGVVRSVFGVEPEGWDYDRPKLLK